jgi:hypothetical protein
VGVYIAIKTACIHVCILQACQSRDFVNSGDVFFLKGRVLVSGCEIVIRGRVEEESTLSC